MQDSHQDLRMTHCVEGIGAGAAGKNSAPDFTVQVFNHASHGWVHKLVIFQCLVISALYMDMNVNDDILYLLAHEDNIDVNEDNDDQNFSLREIPDTSC